WLQPAALPDAGAARRRQPAGGGALRLDDARRSVGGARLRRLLRHGPGGGQRRAPRSAVGRCAARREHRRAANASHAKWRVARITVKKIAGALGAEIGGIDLRELANDDVAAICAAWLEHLVLFLRDQPLTPAQFMAFAKRI